MNTRCDNCGSDVSHGAVTCPSCGDLQEVGGESLCFLSREQQRRCLRWLNGKTFVKGRQQGLVTAALRVDQWPWSPLLASEVARLVDGYELKLREAGLWIVDETDDCEAGTTQKPNDGTVCTACV